MRLNPYVSYGSQMSRWCCRHSLMKVQKPHYYFPWILQPHLLCMKECTFTFRWSVCLCIKNLISPTNQSWGGFVLFCFSFLFEVGILETTAVFCFYPTEEFLKFQVSLLVKTYTFTFFPCKVQLACQSFCSYLFVHVLSIYFWNK